MAEPLRLGILATHPIQYYAPWYRALAARPELDLTVYFAHQQTAAGQAAAGFGVEFEWDVPLLEGYRYEFLPNVAKPPGTHRFAGCDTPSMGEAIRRGRYDAFLVHGWGFKCYWQAMRACWRQGVPLMVRGDSHLLTPRGRLKRWIKELAYPRFIPRFDAYLCVGERARQYYLAYGADRRRMVFCPHFVDNDRFAAAAQELRPQRAALRSAWQIPADPLCVLFCGKFISKKRPLDLALAARKAMGKAGGSRPIQLLFVGSGELGGELRAACHVVFDAEGSTHSVPCPQPGVGMSRSDASMVTQSSGHGTSHRPKASFAGFLNQSQIARAYVAADVLVLPSDGGETWGLVVNEAMASGMPAVVSDQVGCAPDLIREGETGYVFPCGDLDALAAILTRLVAELPLTTRLGEAARKNIAQYSIAAAVEATVAAVQQIASHRASANAVR